MIARGQPRPPTDEQPGSSAARIDSHGQMTGAKMGAMLGESSSRLVRSDGFRVLLATVLASAGYFFTDRIPVNGGLGYDGIFYTEVARDPYQRIFLEGVDDYRIIRILPSLVVHAALKLLGIPITDPNILDAFALLNVGMIVITAWLWCLLARRLGIGVAGKWFGFVGLFFSFAI